MADNILTQDHLKALFEYRDGDLYRKISVASNAREGDKVGCISGCGYKHFQINKKYYRLHRIIFMYHYGYMPKIVDHIDGDILNNKIENLRECTQLENKQNSKRLLSAKRPVKNVYWHEKWNKWAVTIKVNKKAKHIGGFNNIELAELVAFMAREKYHGIFANHN